MTHFKHEIKLSQWGSDWLFLNTQCTVHLTDAKGEVGNTLGPVGHIKIVNKDKFPISFTSSVIVGGSVIVGPGQTYFNVISSPQVSAMAIVEFNK